MTDRYGNDRRRFKPHRGRVYHQKGGEYAGMTIAECGVRFRVVHFAGDMDTPTCPKCRRVLAERAALVPIAAALMSEYCE